MPPPPVTFARERSARPPTPNCFCVKKKSKEKNPKTEKKMAGRGDSCYFPRDLGRGSYGGDVHCFQQFLSNKGYLLEEPTGYFGERTATAAKRWQVREMMNRNVVRACHDATHDTPLL